MLNLTQKIIIVAVVFCIAVMVIYPPWVIFYRSKSFSIVGPYAFIWSPPKLARFIDLYRLGAQLVSVFVIAVGLCLVCDTKSEREDER